MGGGAVRRLIHAACGQEIEPLPQVGENVGYCFTCIREVFGTWVEGKPELAPAPAPAPVAPKLDGAALAREALIEPAPAHGGNGHDKAATKLDLPYMGEGFGKLSCAVTITEKRASALVTEWGNDGPSLDYLPLLGLNGYIVKGWSHLVCGYPKCGKTELLARLCQSWPRENILFFTEEPESVWGERLAALGGAWEHMTLAFALGAGQDAVLARILSGRETVIIIDTVRNLLGLRDETDNSEVARMLNPVITACRKFEKTLILAHHLRKAGGEHGTAITGGHAFLGVVDVALEVGFADGNAPNRRKIRGWGRIIAIPELLYDMADDLSFKPLGSPHAVEVANVKRRVLDVLNGQWQAFRDIHAAMDAPKPGREYLRLALQELVTSGDVDRDPPDGGRGKAIRYRVHAG